MTVDVVSRARARAPPVLMNELVRRKINVNTAHGTPYFYGERLVWFGCAIVFGRGIALFGFVCGCALIITLLVSLYFISAAQVQIVEGIRLTRARTAFYRRR